MITTSRYATGETKEDARKLAEKNNERYVARGKKTVKQLVEWARKNGDEIITILEEKGKKPAGMNRITVKENGEWSWQ